MEIDLSKLDLSRLGSFRHHGHRFAVGTIWLLAIAVGLWDWDSIREFSLHLNSVAAQLSTIAVPPWAYAVFFLLTTIFVPYSLSLVFAPTGHWLLNALLMRTYASSRRPPLVTRVRIVLQQPGRLRWLRDFLAKLLYPFEVSSIRNWNHRRSRGPRGLYARANQTISAMTLIPDTFDIWIHLQVLELLDARVGHNLHSRYDDLLFRGAVLLPCAFLVGWLGHIACTRIGVPFRADLSVSCLFGLIVFIVSASSLNLAIMRLGACIDMAILVIRERDAKTDLMVT